MDATETEQAYQQALEYWLALYSSNGFRCFPIYPRSKVPYPGFAWKERATSDLDELLSMFRAHPGSNVAIATGKGSNLTVIDLDVKTQEQREADGVLFFERIIGAMAPQVDGFLCEVVTPSGGKHIYMRYLEGFPTTHSAMGCLDIQNDNAYVLVPPSRIEGAGEYTVTGR